MPDFRITIDIKDVAEGDVELLVTDIENNFGNDFDMAKGDFTVRPSKKIGDGYFPLEVAGDNP